MLILPNDDFNVNKFVDVKLPSKRQIFSRTGGKAVTPNGVYTKDDVASFGHHPTESAMDFVSAAEEYDSTKADLPSQDENG